MNEHNKRRAFISELAAFPQWVFPFRPGAERNKQVKRSPIPADANLVNAPCTGQLAYLAVHERTQLAPPGGVLFGFSVETIALCNADARCINDVRVELAQAPGYR